MIRKKGGHKDKLERNFIKTNVKSVLRRLLNAKRRLPTVQGKHRRKNKEEKRSILDNGRAFFATVCGSGHTINDIIPDNALFSRACFSTGRNIMISHALDTFIGMNIIDVLARWVIILINNRLDRTLVDARSATDAGIGNQYSHYLSL
jgi:hypothetical protein